MAIKKGDNKNDKKAEAKLQIEVKRAKELENVIMFDMEINGIMIYGCSYRELERKDGSGSFVKIGFPSRKGSDGNYYNHVYVKLSDDDIDAIEKGIEALI